MDNVLKFISIYLHSIEISFFAFMIPSPNGEEAIFAAVLCYGKWSHKVFHLGCICIT